MTSRHPIPHEVPLPSNDKRRLDEARRMTLTAVDRLVLAGQEGDIVIIKLGKEKRIYVHDYGKAS